MKQSTIHFYPIPEEPFDVIREATLPQWQGQGVLEKLLEELGDSRAFLEGCLTERKNTKTSEQERPGPAGMLQNFPMLEAVIHESSRCVMADSISFGGRQLDRSGRF